MNKTVAKKILSADSNFLCVIIATFRMVSINHDEALLAMAELMRREENGDNFDYDSKIKNIIETHGFKLKTPGLNDLKQHIVKFAVESIFVKEEKEDDVPAEVIKEKVEEEPDQDYTDVVNEIQNIMKDIKVK